MKVIHAWSVKTAIIWIMVVNNAKKGAINVVQLVVVM